MPDPRLMVWPAKTTFAATDELGFVVQAQAEGRGQLSVSRLGSDVTTLPVSWPAGRSGLSLDPVGLGGYGVVLEGADGAATTAFDVQDDPCARPRYGFVSDFDPGRDDIEAVVDSACRFHLNLVQYYDWMYRHARLLPPEDEFVDALGRSLSMATTRDFVAALRAVGSRSLGYAAVYGAGEDYVRDHPEQVLASRTGTPYTLADFLWIMDLTPDGPWQKHIVTEMARAVHEVGFDGLHLDQYGFPKTAATGDGRVVDLAADFPRFIDAVRLKLPESTLIFNNVNDFGTRSTAAAHQDATYIEVWPPHLGYRDLVDLVRVAGDVAPRRPVILAAYLEPFAGDDGPGALAAAKLALSVVWGAGGHYLLFGEDRGVLVDPYYPKYETLTEQATEELVEFADFGVAMGDLLYDDALVDVTGSHFSGINDDLVVEGAETSPQPESGRLFVTLRTDGRRAVVSLVDLRKQADDRWNAAKRPPGTTPPLVIRLKVPSEEARVLWGSPGAGPRLVPLPCRFDGDYLVAEVPGFDTWSLMVVSFG